MSSHTKCPLENITYHNSLIFISAPSSHPSNSTGYALNSTHIYLSWDPPPLDEINGLIREYRINVTEAETGTLVQYSVQPGEREFIVGSLQPFHTYHCIIVAYTVDVSPTTATITVRTDEDGKQLQKIRAT